MIPSFLFILGRRSVNLPKNISFLFDRYNMYRKNHHKSFQSYYKRKIYLLEWSGKVQQLELPSDQISLMIYWKIKLLII